MEHSTDNFQHSIGNIWRVFYSAAVFALEQFSVKFVWDRCTEKSRMKATIFERKSLNIKQIYFPVEFFTLDDFVWCLKEEEEKRKKHTGDHVVQAFIVIPVLATDRLFSSLHDVDSDDDLMTHKRMEEKKKYNCSLASTLSFFFCL